MFRLTLAGLLVGCPSAPKGNGSSSKMTNFVIDGESDADADADAPDADADADAADADTDADADADSDAPMPMLGCGCADADADSDADSDPDTDASWPYSGTYTADLSIVGEWWGEWCVGTFRLRCRC